MPLQHFLASKPLYYREIDHERVHAAYQMLKPHIRQPDTVHIVGTNGKGSIGRMIAHLAWRSTLENATDKSTHLSVGHYTSPHILTFNERIWLNGEEASDAVLEVAHQRLYGILGEEMSDALSYFEYSTLLAFVVFEDCDLVILEAGLGGEFDATNVCDKKLSVITPIGIDHQAFLGDSIEEIAATKIRSIQKFALIAPQPYEEVIKAAKEIARDVGADLRVCLEPNTQVDPYGLQKIATIKGWPQYLIQNASVAMQALDVLDVACDVNDLKALELFGRFYALTENIRIDVGHNPLAAHAIEKALDGEVVLVYNALEDKDYREVLRILQPKIKRVEIISIDTQRAETVEKIGEVLDEMGVSYSTFQNRIDREENYLVFGSFYTVEAFLKQRKEHDVPK